MNILPCILLTCIFYCGASTSVFSEEKHVINNNPVSDDSENSLLTTLNDRAETTLWIRSICLNNLRIECQERYSPNLGEASNLPAILPVNRWISGIRIRDIKSGILYRPAWFAEWKDWPPKMAFNYETIASPYGKWIALPYLSGQLYIQSGINFGEELAHHKPTGKTLAFYSSNNQAYDTVTISKWINEDAVECEVGFYDTSSGRTTVSLIDFTSSNPKVIVKLGSLDKFLEPIK